MLEFKIIIPSKNRIDIIKNNVLKFITNNNLDKNEIYIFVNKKDYPRYKKEFINDHYNIILGRDGLINQRNFIKDYFNENVNLLFLDDDLTGINYTGNFDLNILISQDFRHMINNNITLGSINPTNNSYFKRNEYLYGLYLAVGCYYLEINKKNKTLYLDNIYNSEKEDYLRTIKHYCYSGRIYRNDYLNVIHKYNKKDKGGMLFENRLINNNKCCDYIYNKYPNLTKIFYKNKGTKKEIKFNNNKCVFKKLYLDVKINSKLGKYYNDINYKILDKNKNYLLYDKKTNTLMGVIIRNIFQGLFNLDLLDKITKKGTCNRSNIAGEIDINKLDYSKERKKLIKESDLIYINDEKTRCRLKSNKFQMCNKFQSNNLGYLKLRKELQLTTESKKYDNDFKKDYNDILEIINNLSKLHYPIIYKPVINYMNTIFTGITINNNTRAGNHYDTTNKGFCSMFCLGDFEGCNLLFPDYKLNLNLNKNKDLVLFDSKNIKHCNSEYINDNNKRFSLVFFINQRCF